MENTPNAKGHLGTEQPYFAEKNRKARTGLYVFLVVLSIICIVPFYLMIINATHNNSDIATKFNYLPGKDLINNYQRMQQQINIWRGYLNSFLLAGIGTVINLYFSSLTAYGFAKYNFKGRNVLFWFILGTMMVPGQLGLIGYFQLIKFFNLLDNYLALWLPAVASAGTVFWIRQYCQAALPGEIIESARIDGSHEIYTFHRIVMPIISPALATMGIFSFIFSWNNLLGPMILIFTKSKFPLPVLVVMMKGFYSTDYGAQYLGIAMSVIPIMIIFVFLARKIMDGLTIGALKG